MRKEPTGCLAPESLCDTACFSLEHGQCTWFAKGVHWLGLFKQGSGPFALCAVAEERAQDQQIGVAALQGCFVVAILLMLLQGSC